MSNSAWFTANRHFLFRQRFHFFSLYIASNHFFLSWIIRLIIILILFDSLVTNRLVRNCRMINHNVYFLFFQCSDCFLWSHQFGVRNDIGILHNVGLSRHERSRQSVSLLLFCHQDTWLTCSATAIFVLLSFSPTLPPFTPLVNCGPTLACHSPALETRAERKSPKTDRVASSSSSSWSSSHLFDLGSIESFQFESTHNLFRQNDR